MFKFWKEFSHEREEWRIGVCVCEYDKFYHISLQVL